jgi:hypothetical protein
MALIAVGLGLLAWEGLRSSAGIRTEARA